MRNRGAASAAIVGACILAVVLMPVPSAFAAGPRKQSEYAVAYQINPAHSGSINFSAGFTAPLTQIWSVNLDSSLSYPVVAEGKVFVNSSAGQTYALDLATGTTKWSKNTGVTLGPTYDRRSLFLLNSNAVLSALSAKSGKSLWATQLTGELDADSSPMAYKGQVFAVATENAGIVYGVNETLGSLNWGYQWVQNGDNSSPAYGDNGIYVSYSCQYYKLDPVSGVLDWWDDSGCNGGSGNTPVYYAKRVYVEDPANGNFILDAGNGDYMGTFGANNGDPPAFWQISKGKSLGFSLDNGYLYGWTASTGTNVWSFAGDGQLSTPPIVINGLVAEGSASGNVYLLDSSTGTQEWSGNTGAGVTALGAGQGTLIVISGSVVTAYAPQ
jgi:outer membrane protein assembly factor BamB